MISNERLGLGFGPQAEQDLLNIFSLIISTTGIKACDAGKAAAATGGEPTIHQF